MTNSLKRCPTSEQLKALIDGSLLQPDQAAFQLHLEQCPACQQKLESLVAGDESWDSALSHLRYEDPGSRDAVLAEAIRQMKADEVSGDLNPSAESVTSLNFLTPSDRPGSLGRLGTYEVTELIGHGGMGIVLKAFDPSLHRVVAVKVLAPYLAHNPQARKRFIREAQAIAAVSHDHVITIHAIDESAEQPKIVMQYVAGRSLQQKIDVEGSLELKEILRIGMQTAAGLAAAHAQGLVHRDIKPSNILLENGVQRVRLTDFGLARAVDDASLTQSGAIAGTPQYMAPEQANGDAVDFRADLFSLGSVIYAMCVGHSPFRASTTMGVLKRVCLDAPRPIQELNPDIPDWLCSIVMKLLEKKPEDRFPTAKSVADLLEQWLAHVQQPMVVPRPQLVQGQPQTDQSANPSQTHRTSSFIQRVLAAKGKRIGFNADAYQRGRRESHAVPDTHLRRSFGGNTIWGRILAIFVAIVSNFIAFFMGLGLFVVKCVQTILSKIFGIEFGKSANALESGDHRWGWKKLWIGIKGRFDKNSPDSNRLFLSIGWFLVAGFDLLLAIISLVMLVDRGKAGILFLMVPSIVLFVIAVLVSYCIHVRQHGGFVQAMSFICLLPLSPGSLFGIPLSIITLLWMCHNDTQELFAKIPFPDSYFGKLLYGGTELARRMFVTIACLTGWSIGWIVALVAIFVLYVVPYAPANYYVGDKCRVTLRGHQNAQFDLSAFGEGSVEGLIPHGRAIKRKSVCVGCTEHNLDEGLLVRLGAPMTIADSNRELTQQDIESRFISRFGQAYSEHAESLLRSIRRLNAEEGLGGLSGNQSVSQVRSEDDRINTIDEVIRRLHSPSNQPWPGFVRLGSMLDQTMFDVQPARDSQFDCHFSPIEIVMGICIAIAIWICGCGWIIKQRHFTTTEPMAVSEVVNQVS